MKVIHAKKLHIKRGKEKNNYHLVGENRALGTLDLHNNQASKAQMKVGDKSWTLKRGGIMKREVQIHDDSIKNLTSAFSSNWRCRGMLSLNSKVYYWGPANKLWTHWAWKDEEGRELIRIKTKPSLRGIEAEVAGDIDLATENRRYLSLVGWYTLLLYHQDPDALILTGIESSLKKVRQLIAR